MSALVSLPERAQRLAQWWDQPIGPLPTKQGVVLLRPPKLSDARQWCQVRRANESRLREAFPAATPNWSQGQTEVVWAQRVDALRRAARHGHALPYVVTIDGQVRGEYGIDAIDAETGTGEQSGWLSKEFGGAVVASVAVALAVLHAFSGPRPLQRIVGPNAVDLPAPGVLLATLGYERESVLTRLRGSTSGRKDYEIWVVHNTPQARRTLTGVLERRRVG